MEKLLIALFPIIGSLTGKKIPKDYLFLLIFVPFALLIPQWFSPYDYSIFWLDEVLLTLTLSGIWGLLVRITENTKAMEWTSTLLTVALGLILLLVTFATAFTGSNSTLKQWNNNNYQVNYVESRGFSGRPFYYYELKKYNCFGLFEATAGRYELNDADKNLCTIQLFDKLDYRYVSFDPCKGTIIHP